MSEYLIQSETLEDIADAIRSKTGGSALIAPEDMADEIESIQTGGMTTHTGEVTVVGSGITSVTIQHGFSTVPLACAIYPKYPINIAGNHVVGGITITLFSLVSNLSFASTILKTGWWTDSNNRQGKQELISGSAGNYVKNITSSSFDLTASASYPIYETTYIWKAIGEE